MFVWWNRLAESLAVSGFPGLDLEGEESEVFEAFGGSLEGADVYAQFLSQVAGRGNVDVAIARGS